MFALSSLSSSTSSSFILQPVRIYHLFSHLLVVTHCLSSHSLHLLKICYLGVALLSTIFQDFSIHADSPSDNLSSEVLDLFASNHLFLNSISATVSHTYILDTVG